MALGIWERIRDRGAHPLSGLEPARAWWKKIDAPESELTLAAVQTLIDEFLAEKPGPTASRLDAVCFVDAMAQPALDTATYRYVQNPKMPPAMEQLLWKQITGFAETLIKAYLMFIRDSSGDDGVGEGDDLASTLARLALPVARTIRYLGLLARMHYFRGKVPDLKIWNTLNQLYLLAEVHRVGSTRLTLYDSVANPISTCTDEFLRVTMLATIADGSFTVRQLALIDRWLEYLSPHFVVESSPVPLEHQYWVALSASLPAQRFVGQSKALHGRYWGTAEFLYCLLNARSRPAGSYPAGLLESLAMPGAGDLIRRVEQAWTGETDQKRLRSSERRKTGGEIAIQHGLAEISLYLQRRVAAIPAVDVHDTTEGMMLDMSQYGIGTRPVKPAAVAVPAPVAAQVAPVDAVPQWPLLDISEGGASFQLPGLNHPWARLHALLGGSVDRKTWKMAIVRRVWPTDDGENLRVSVQWLATDIEPMVIRGGVVAGASMPRSGLRGLVLPSGQAADVPEALFVPVTAYQRDAELRIEWRNRPYSLRLRDPVVNGEDWIMVKAERSR